MNISKKLGLFLEQYDYDLDQYYILELDIMEKIVDFIRTLKDDDLSDEAYNHIAEAFIALLDVLITMENVELDFESNRLLYNIFLELEDLDEMDVPDTEDEDEDEDINEVVKPYKARRIRSGKKRSKASYMRGSQKQKYIKRLRDRKRKYKTNAALRLKVKKRGRKYRRTSGAKQKRRLYKTVTKHRK